MSMNTKVETNISRASLQQRIAVCQQVAKLVRARLPIAGKLRTFSEDGTKREKELAQSVDAGIAEGQSLSALLANDESRHSRILRACIDAGEASGQLDQTLHSWTAMHIANTRSTKRLRSAMLYPLALIIVTLVSLGLVTWQLIPQYRVTYEMFEHELPTWLAGIVWVREQFGVFSVLFLLLLLLPLIVWYFMRQGTNSIGLPNEISQRYRQQALAAEVAGLMLEAQIPLQKIASLSTQVAGASAADTEKAFSRIQEREHAVPHATEASLLLSSMHTGVIDANETRKNLQELADSLQRVAEARSRSQARWLPMLVALTVGILTIATYVFLVYLPWIWLMQDVMDPVKIQPN